MTSILLSPDVYEHDVPVGKRKGYIVVRQPQPGPAPTSEDLQAYVARGLRLQTQLAGITGQQTWRLDVWRYSLLCLRLETQVSVRPLGSLASEIISSIQNLVSSSLDKATSSASPRTSTSCWSTRTASSTRCRLRSFSLKR